METLPEEIGPLDLRCRRDLPAENEICSPASRSVFSCDTCCCLFSARDQLKKHHHSEHPPMYQGMLRCTYSSYCCDLKARATKHARSHSGKRPFSCSVCGQGFTKKYSLDRHSMIHSGDKPHICVDCGRSFQRPDYLKLHSVVHSGEKPYECADCRQRFTRACRLARHRTEQHLGAGGGPT